MVDESQTGTAPVGPAETGDLRLHLSCDRCGATMVGLQCKIICLNCGYRFDCSDLSIYFD